MGKYIDEREGQIAFYEVFLPRVDKTLSIDDLLSDNNDGVLNGNLLEFKLSIKNLNAAQFQVVKYLSARRIKGKEIPAKFVLVDLTKELAFIYDTEQYLEDIEKVYTGPASKENKGYAGKPYSSKLNYATHSGADQLVRVLRQTAWVKIHLDENCIVGWAERYYRENPSARKEDFIGDETGKYKKKGEIRSPKRFADFIHPYVGKTNEQFKYLMDRLNDRLQKKNLGAFYTPSIYAEKTHELLRKAISRVPKGNDYIILDRCAGTGALERGLQEEELSHCILSTIEYYEYKVLQEILGDKVRHIIPPVESEDTFDLGNVRGADALSKEYIENPIVKQYLDDPKCTIILFENPPYAETTSLEHQRTGAGKKASSWKKSYVVSEMKKEIKGAAVNDLGNAFIWSAFKFYLRQDTDSYIVYSPVKYWKAQHLISKHFIDGFAFNRRWFHTKIDACIMVALWTNEDDDIETIKLRGYDIDKAGMLTSEVILPVSKIKSLFSEKYYEKRPFDDAVYNGILTGLNGEEASASVKCRIKPVYSKDMLGYLVADSVGFDNPDAKSSLLVAGRYNGNGCFIRKDDYLDKLPLFCASRYISNNAAWTERARIMKSADGADKYIKDVKYGKLDQWLRKCLLFTCLETQNHMRTFTGSDGRFYRNELCLDTSNGQTIASKDINKLKKNSTEKELIKLWKELLKEAKGTEEYDSSLTYGVYQIIEDIDVSYKDITGKTIYKNVEVHSVRQTLKEKVREYYNTEIAPTLFKYEFLK